MSGEAKKDDAVSKQCRYGLRVFHRRAIRAEEARSPDLRRLSEDRMKTKLSRDEIKAEKVMAEFVDPEGADLESAIVAALRSVRRAERRRCIAALNKYQDGPYIMGAKSEIFSALRGKK